MISRSVRIRGSSRFTITIAWSEISWMHEIKLLERYIYLMWARKLARSGFASRASWLVLNFAGNANISGISVYRTCYRISQKINKIQIPLPDSARNQADFSQWHRTPSCSIQRRCTCAARIHQWIRLDRSRDRTDGTGVDWIKLLMDMCNKSGVDWIILKLSI